MKWLDFLLFASRLFRACPAGIRGKTRLARWVFPKSALAREVCLQDFSGNCFTVPSLNEPIGFHLLIDGEYEPDVLSQILGRLEKGGTFIDVGANIGLFTVPTSRKLGSAGCVVAVEASPRVFPYLQKNVAANSLDNVRLSQMAAFSEKTELQFYDAPVESFGMGSLGPQFAGDHISVSADRLDDIVPPERMTGIQVIKIDVEGFELRVLQGATRILEQSRPLVVFEFCDWAEARLPDGKAGDAQRFLMRLGFSVWRLHDWISGRPPLSEPVTNGSDMLIAAPGKDSK